MSEKPVREHDKVMLRLPDGMRDTLKAAADGNKRSMNAEIVARLGQSFGWDATSATLEEHLDLLRTSRGILEGQVSTLVDLAERFGAEAKAEKARADDLQRRIDHLSRS